MRTTYFLLALSAFIIFSCNPAVKKVGVPTAEPDLVLSDSAAITVNSENVRLSPNGELWGTIKKNDKIEIIKRIGNWINFHSEEYDSAFIWAPSAGFEYLNLYNPKTYYNSAQKTFYPKSYFQQLFGSEGRERQDLSTEYELFFDEIGLGSHQETVLEVVTTTTAKVNHGVTFFIDKKTDQIFKVKIDFYKPIKGLLNALKKCNFQDTAPSIENSSHIIWQSGVLFEQIEVDLERTEWDSNNFSTIWFTKIADES